MAFQQIKVIGIARVLAAALGGVVVGASSVVKVPQILKVVNPPTLEGRIKVANGITLEGLSLETLSQLIHIVYNFQNKNSFVNYGETALVGIQNVIIILLIEYYRLRQHFESISNSPEKLQIEYSLKELQKPILTMFGIFIFLTKIAPSSLIDGLQILGIPISIVGKIPQLRKNYLLKSTSHLSNITIGANVLGTAIRVFTTIKGTRKALKPSDYVLLTGYSSGLILNLILAGQAVYYGKFYTASTDEDEAKKDI
ncbi:mannose-P-dolichol utilization defect 1 protein [Hyphopichia burtonii NRRL Y-1933]|uniref:Solute carrier family 66 member 3 n=1 Tax=Hyphopichia burtonii NRRL Y-1933 TaxID=984485 RepID=A0A1E4RMA7_9ASCO|nr:mannose-P-dolichol utilization defect 1 protein [Hyphopichia burtonii NRRL Y-1933]ODV68376.1 mannose-P-dolichol utilization defect 1 protein [Hyphopichia burtonii NRRL Y-1933]